MTDILTKEEFIEKYPDNGLFSFENLEPNKNFETHFFLEFENPEFLCAPYAEKYAYISITNENHGHEKLKSEIENYNDWIKYCNSCIYNLAYPIQQAINKLPSYEYISGRYDATTGEPVPSTRTTNYSFFFEENTDSKSSTLNHPYLEKHICSCETYSQFELMTAIQVLLEEKTPEEVNSLLKKSQEKIKQEISNFERISDISYDRPYSLHISGTDDTSYGATFSSMKELNEVLEKIKQKPTIDTVNQYLEYTN